jgi:hypothetical protein
MAAVTSFLWRGFVSSVLGLAPNSLQDFYAVGKLFLLKKQDSTIHPNSFAKSARLKEHGGAPPPLGV